MRLLFTLAVNQSTLEDIEAAQKALQAVKADITGDGLEGMLTLAVGQLERFVAGNIEVKTGRTKNSVFGSVSGSGNSVEAFLGTNVSYSPFVRNASHSKQFFAYAADVEGPHVQKWLGDEVDLRVERGFNK